MGRVSHSLGLHELKGRLVEIPRNERGHAQWRSHICFRGHTVFPPAITCKNPFLPPNQSFFLFSLRFFKGLRLVTGEGLGRGEAAQGRAPFMVRRCVTSCHPPSSVPHPDAAELWCRACPFAGLLLSIQSSSGLQESLLPQDRFFLQLWNNFTKKTQLEIPK